MTIFGPRSTRGNSASWWLLLMEVLSVASEAYPLVKTGGLADVAGALPAALRAEGVHVRTLLPGYPPVLAALGLGEPAWVFEDFFGGPARLLRRHGRRARRVRAGGAASL